MSRMSLPMVIERERVAKLKKAQQSGQKQAQKPAAGGLNMAGAIGGLASAAGRVGGAIRTGEGAARAAGAAARIGSGSMFPLFGQQKPPASQEPFRTQGPLDVLGLGGTSTTSPPPRRFPTFEAEAAHAKRLQGLSAAVPLPTRPASATPPQVGPTKAELTRMRPNDGPQPQTTAAPPDDRARLMGREREIREALNRQRRLSLTGSPEFDPDAVASLRGQGRDIALLLREPERRGRTAEQIQSARSSLREQGFDFARQQLEAAIPPERLAQIESGAAVELTPEERAAIEEFDRIGGGLNKSLPAIPDQIGREMARGEAERAKAANQRLIDQQAVLRQEDSTFQTDEAARRDRDLAAVREREIQAALQKAAIAQAQQVGREAGSEANPNTVEGVTSKIQLTEAQRALARQQANFPSDEMFIQQVNTALSNLDPLFKGGIGTILSQERGVILGDDPTRLSELDAVVRALARLRKVDPQQASIFAGELLRRLPPTGRLDVYEPGGFTNAGLIPGTGNAEGRRQVSDTLNRLRAQIQFLAAT